MNTTFYPVRSIAVIGLAGYILLAVLSFGVGAPKSAQKSRSNAPSSSVVRPLYYTSVIRPILAKYCLGCHSTAVKKGGLDLQRFATSGDIRKDVKPWQHLLE